MISIHFWKKNREALQCLPIPNDLRPEQLFQVVFRAIRSNKLEANEIANTEIVTFKIVVFGGRDARTSS